MTAVNDPTRWAKCPCSTRSNSGSGQLRVPSGTTRTTRLPSTSKGLMLRPDEGVQLLVRDVLLGAADLLAH